MLYNLVEYFSKRHLLTNFLMLGVFIGGIFGWVKMSKEEMPDITFDRVRISTSYPGASCEDVEYFVTRPIEEVLVGLDGIDNITSNSSQGSSNISIELSHSYKDRDTIISDIKSYVLDVRMPEGVRDEPRIREFKTSRKAIIDIGVFNKNVNLLNPEQRFELQEFVNSVESRLVNLPSIAEVSFTGFLDKEIHIELNSEKLKQYNISVTDVYNVLKKQHLRVPIGTIDGDISIKFSLQDELDVLDKLENIIIQGSFEEKNIRLSEISDIEFGFDEVTSLSKINGYEAIVLRVTKNGAYGIIEAIKEVKDAIGIYKAAGLEDSEFDLVLLDDESRDVRNRLSIIGKNGLIGFALILIMLFIFLNFKSGFWVAVGIPFSFCFTILISYFLGYSVNNVTLAAIIIVMGMIVDDAIVVAENITRLESSGVPRSKAVVEGTVYVFLPIVASVVTTCIAFIPLFFFTGHIALLIKFIPMIIIFMLGGSLLESLFILPSHLNKDYLGLKKFISLLRNRKVKKVKPNGGRHWFHKVEDKYGKFLEKGLKYKYVAMLFFIFLFIFSGWLAVKKMKFTMFPREETTQVRLGLIAPKGTKKYKTEELVRPVEEIFKEYLGGDMVGFRTQVARSRRGNVAKENEASLRIEIVPKEQRKKSLKALIMEWNKKLDKIEGFDKIHFSRGHFGQQSGSAIEILVKDNNEESRNKAVSHLLKVLTEDKRLENAEQERQFRDLEYKVSIKRDLAKKLNVDVGNIATTLRAAVEGVVTYTYKEEDREVDAVLTIDIGKDVDKVMDVPIANQFGYLVPLRDVVDIKKERTVNVIKRKDFKRITSVYADIKEGKKITPLEIAAYYEQQVFPKILNKYPSTTLAFEGEIKDAREAKENFLFAVILALTLIYFVLALLFNSLYKPFIIMLTIPFGVVGVILALKMHGVTLYGFFTGIGILGLSGVVVNDSIVMLVKLEKEFDKKHFGRHPIRKIANIAKTRLRAVILTTLTTVAGLMPSAYGIGGYDSMLAEMMLAMSWGLIFGTCITLYLIPATYNILVDVKRLIKKW